MSEENKPQQQTEEAKKVSPEEMEKLHNIIKQLVERSDLCMVEDRIATYLKMLGLKFEKSQELNAFVVPYVIKTKDREHKHLIIIRTSGPWLILSVGIISKDDIPPTKTDDLYKELLQANHKYPEFSYDIDVDGNVGYTEDIFIPALTFDVFAEEFLSIPAAIRYFWETIFPSIIGGEKPRKTDFYYT